MTKTAQELITRVRRAADMENSNFCTDDEIFQYINNAGAELHDILVSEFEDYMMLSGSFQLTGSQNMYQFDHTVHKLRGIDKLSANLVFPLVPYSFTDRGTLSTGIYMNYTGVNIPKYRWLGDHVTLLPSTFAQGNFNYYYVPEWTDLVSVASGSLPDLYCTNRWEEYVVIDAAINCKSKEEKDISTLQGKKQALYTRIKTAASERDASGRNRASAIEDIDYPDNTWDQYGVPRVRF
jgi:hypothetical protein